MKICYPIHNKIGNHGLVQSTRSQWRLVQNVDVIVSIKKPKKCVPNLKGLVYYRFKHDGPISIFVLELSLPTNKVILPLVEHVVQVHEHA
jgi:hypothetical protein